MKVTRIKAALLGALCITSSVGVGISAASATRVHVTDKKAAQLTLNVAVASNALDWGVFWVAEAAGLFKKNHLTVNPVSLAAGGAAMSYVTSGQADVVLNPSAGGIEATEAGEQTSIIYTAENDLVPAVVGAPAIKSLAQLKTTSNCSYVTQTLGSVVFAQTQPFVKAYAPNCTQQATLLPAQGELGTVIASKYDFGLLAYAQAVAAVNAGEANLLVNPLHLTKQEKAVFQPNTYPALVVIGLKSDLTAHRAAVTAFVKSLWEAGAMINSQKASVLSPLVLNGPNSSIFVGDTPAGFTQAWLAVKQFVGVGPKRGYISKAIWAKELRELQTWGLSGVNWSAPSIQYSQEVDMSYYDAATKGL